jgi:dGTPase
MDIREDIEASERRFLSPYATLSENSRGRDVPEEACDIRPVFQRDRDRILHSKSFRRLKHKTQVFLAPKGDHFRTRLTHSLEVSQTARTIAKALRLNEDLTEAIALGHDLGHAPFGHAGEEALNELMGEAGFSHNDQSVRIVERLEKSGEGLNLTWEVRDGIRNHQIDTKPSTPEGQVVRLSDKIAYLHHDAEDAINAGVIRPRDIPKEYQEILGKTSRERMNTMVHDIVSHSQDSPIIQMSPIVEKTMIEFRNFMFENVYHNQAFAEGEQQAKEIIRRIYEHYRKHMDLLTPKFLTMFTEGESASRVVCDYVSGMTDTYAIEKYEDFFLPKDWMME